MRLDGCGDVDVTGRLIGGCIETQCNFAGSLFADVAQFAGSEPGGLIAYVEASGDDAGTICRNLHGMRLRGYLTGGNAVLVGRTRASSSGTLTQHDALLDALGPGRRGRR